MSAPQATTLADDTEQRRSSARVEFIGQEGDYWLKKHAAEFAALPAGTAVVINIVNGEYVTATTRLAAMDKFDQKFGTDTTFGFVHEIGRPVFVGGGVV